MRFGVCGGPDVAAVAAVAGYDYFEWSVGDCLKPLDGQAAFDAALAQVKAAPIPCEALNCFVPANLKITGNAVDDAALDRYVQTVMERAERAGVSVIVFGSGGARAIPDGFDPAAAHRQLVTFGRMAAAHAAAHGVVVAVEPLNDKECNVLTGVAESASYVREVDRPALRLLVDGYHWMRGKGTVAEITAAGPLLVHTHIATEANRRAPGAEPCDFAPFFNALKRAGYQGCMSFEGGLTDSEKELRSALALMRSFA